MGNFPDKPLLNSGIRLPMGSTPKRALRILVADDNHAHCYAVSKRLVSLGFEVRQAFDGYSALRCSRGFPDLILMDIHMPGLDGFEVCRRVKQDPTSAHIPVLLFSATIDVEECRPLALQVGGVDLFPAAEAINLAPYIHNLISRPN
jgi:CheY-like chemotaxis protein